MKLRNWLMHLLNGKPQIAPEGVKERLTSRQLDVAGRLAKMKGVTRDDVLSEAYRRARMMDEDASFRRSR